MEQETIKKIMSKREEFGQSSDLKFLINELLKLQKEDIPDKLLTLDGLVMIYDVITTYLLFDNRDFSSLLYVLQEQLFEAIKKSGIIFEN